MYAIIIRFKDKVFYIVERTNTIKMDTRDFKEINTFIVISISTRVISFANNVKSPIIIIKGLSDFILTQIQLS